MTAVEPSTKLSRRGFVAGLGVGLPLLASPVMAQQAQYGRVRVDVSQLREKGLGRYASFVSANLDRAVQNAFAGRTGIRGAPDLVVRIRLVQLATLPDGGGGRKFGGMGGGSSDYMDGEALIIQRGQVIRQHPQLMSFPSSSGSAWYDPDNELKRTAALCVGYASWLARAL